MPRRVSLFVLVAALGITGVASGGPQARVAAHCRAHDGLPDKTCAPGVRDPRVRQKNIAKTICKAGYTQTVRPPSSYTTKLKKQQIAEYGYYAGRVNDH